LLGTRQMTTTDNIRTTADNGRGEAKWAALMFGLLFLIVIVLHGATGL